MGKKEFMSYIEFKNKGLDSKIDEKSAYSWDYKEVILAENMNKKMAKNNKNYNLEEKSR